MKLHPYTARALNRLVVCASLALAPYAAIAVTISDSEWRAWPAFCQAAFLSSDYGRESPFAGNMPPAQLQHLRSTHATSNGIPGAHHFCVGITYINRAKARKASAKYNEILKNAINEIDYSFSRITPEAPKYSLVTAYYGTALYLSGNRERAVSMWENGIRTKPESRESYLAMAEALLSEKKPNDALAVLKRYQDAKTGDAPDAEAFLAFTYIELKQYDKAKEHADKAYELGYPLPGLRNRIDRLSK